MAFVVVPALIGLGYYRIQPAHSDFMLYYRDARIGWSFGWSHIYDLADFRSVTHQLGIDRPDQNSGSLSLPLLTWLVAPYALLPMPLAYAAWFVTLAGVASFSWFAVAPSVPAGRWSHLLLAIVFLPLVFAMTLGSAVVLALGAVAGCWWLTHRGHPALAGLVLSVAVIRPQVALLIPVCLLAAGHYRVVAGFLAGLAAVAAATVITVPMSSLVAYVQTMRGVSQNPRSWEVASDLTVTSIRPWLLAIGLIIAIVVVVTVISFLGRHAEQRDAIAILSGMLGSLMVTPYIHLQDLTMLLLAVWLTLRWVEARWWPVVLIPVAGISNFDLSIHTPLPLILEATWLTLLLINRIRVDSKHQLMPVAS